MVFINPVHIAYVVPNEYDEMTSCMVYMDNGTTPLVVAEDAEDFLERIARVME